MSDKTRYIVIVLMIVVALALVLPGKVEKYKNGVPEGKPDVTVITTDARGDEDFTGRPDSVVDDFGLRNCLLQNNFIPKKSDQGMEYVKVDGNLIT